ncbi:MAG: hypothetical protein V3W37_02575, partial [Candidatus Binatia bacterium]
KVDVVAAPFLQGEHGLGNFVSRLLGPDGLLANVPILTENATEIAEAEEDGPRAVPPAEADLLAEMREGARNPCVPTRTANTRFIYETVHVTVSWTGAAVLQLVQSGLYPLVQLARSDQR